MTARFVVGVDLGTTNNVLAYTPWMARNPLSRCCRFLSWSLRRRSSRFAVAVVRYLANPHEVGQGALDLPWASGRDFAVGEMARRQAAEVPDRTVGAAKSWLCHGRVDRRGEILPWNAPPEVPRSRRSPHRNAVPGTPGGGLAARVSRCAAGGSARRVDRARIVRRSGSRVDSRSRAGRRSARPSAAAGRTAIGRVCLGRPDRQPVAEIDEVERRAAGLRRRGGTSDFTLVQVAEEHGELILQRIAVGNHLLVGGDNMDLALAYQASQMFANKNVHLDPWQSVSLWHSCRAAKETMLTKTGPARTTLSVLGRGSKLIGGTVSVEIKRKMVSDLLIEGFFPHCPAHEASGSAPPVGFSGYRLAVRAGHGRDPPPGGVFCKIMARAAKPGRSARRICCSTAACSRPRCSPTA
jgi:hypothetical protein